MIRVSNITYQETGGLLYLCLTLLYYVHIQDADADTSPDHTYILHRKDPRGQLVVQ